MRGSGRNLRIGNYFIPVFVFFVVLLVSLIAGTFIERAVWWCDAKTCEAQGVVYRKDAGVTGDRVGLAAFKYKDGVFHFRWSTLGNPWKQGYWPFIKSAEVTELTGKRLRMILDDYHPAPNWG